jgi:transposase
MAHALCARAPGWAARSAATRADPALHWRHQQAGSGAARSAAACRLRPLDGAAAVEGTDRRVGSVHLARKSWCQTDDPDFVAKAAEIVGLYLDPPQDAIVLAVDEKPHIQALERAQGYLKLPNGRALSGRSHDYKRNGTSTLFAALDVLSGHVTASHYQRRRRIEFLDFMNRIVAAYPGKQIHVILDNLSTHKPKRERWLARHPNVRFHFTPTYSSWLNQIEIWFSILQGSSLAGASFADIHQLRNHIDDFVASYNSRAVPFVWTKARVHQKPLKPRFSDL